MLCLLFCTNFSAQNKYAGLYKIYSGNPDDGGYNWFLFEDHQFAMLTFGTLVSGTWEENESNELTFHPNSPKEKFQVFGRKSENVKGSKMMFANLDINEDSYIGFTPETLQPILNADANCLPRPIVKTLDEKINHLYFSNFTSENNLENKKAFHIKIEDNNDFIVVYYSQHQMFEDFVGKIENNELSINYGEKSSKKRAINPTEAGEIKQFIQQQKAEYSKTVLVTNAGYRFINLLSEGESSENHRAISKSFYNFDGKNQIYTSKDPREFEDAYSDYNTLFEYKLLQFEKVTPPKKLNPKNLLQYTCEEN